MPNNAIERIVDAGHRACGASPAPKAHRYPHSAVGVVRRPAHRERWAILRSRGKKKNAHAYRNFPSLENFHFTIGGDFFEQLL